MLRKLLLPALLIGLAYAFWVSADIKAIAAGVAIFLIGMLALEEGFKAFTGGVLEKVLRRSTDRLWKSLSFGIVSTTLMQSSSLVSVLTISFLSAGLLGLAEGIGIIFGANIGTTTGAWLVAGFGLKVNIAAYAMPMLVFGVVLQFQSSRSLKGLGYILTGMGFLFLGIHYMKEGFEAFRGSFDLSAYAVEGLLGLLLFTLIGTLATVVMQSSHATLVLIITALGAGQISYENALALAIGANIGTTITAIIGAMGANAAGRRLAGAHLIFNLTTGLIAIVFMAQFVQAVEWTSLHAGIAEDNYTLKLAVFHTLFNLVGVAVMLPLIDRLVRLLGRLIPETQQAEPRITRPVESVPQYINEAVLIYPDAALMAINQETRHLYDNAFEIIAHALGLHRHHILSERDLGELVNEIHKVPHAEIDQLYQFRIKGIYSAIIEFASRAESGMTQKQARKLYQLKLANRDIVDAIKDMKDLQANIERYAHAENPHIRAEYNNIRLQLAQTLREIGRIEASDEEEPNLLPLDRMKIELERNDILVNGTLDKLIRNRLINSQMATSLMNDGAYAYNIVAKLIEMAEVLYETEEERPLALDAAAITDIASGG